ncbi:NAD(P)H-hydrate epimerase [Flaviflexus huanghaiensis]|uniref:NAD(P)H-hydrate epimerase n=1 Tax=Flaviflexus huanghaiensis TaxID=1111473 RepID=UPI0015FB88C5|nr:NAD(P)H-hydrate epimerase [Flaviflexus huanghaiensis]
MLRAYRSTDVAAAEKPVLAAGVPLMERASFAVATAAARELKSRGHTVTGSRILVLAGGGNNGGDALFAGAILARRGAVVDIFRVSDSIHEAGLRAATEAGARVLPGERDDVVAAARAAGLWIDGIAGIGLRSPLREPLANLVTLLDEEREAAPDEPIVIAVDCPTGIGVDDGGLPGPALRASVTVAMGVLKPGLLAPPASRLCGRVQLADIGLTLTEPPAVATLTASDVADLLHEPDETDHKYTRGVVLLGTGSADYPGAAVLTAGGALAGGAGMVRLDSPEVIRLVLRYYPEIVIGMGRAQATVLGSGVPVSDVDRLRAPLDRALEEHYPVVLDAGALTLLKDGYADLPSTAVLTPHAGELAELLAARGEGLTRQEIEAAPIRAVRLAATVTGATVVLKGATDLVAGPDGPVYAQPARSHWRATAGAGDVYAGLLGALLAGAGEDIARAGHGLGKPALLAAAASWIHAEAAHSNGPIRASQIADRIPAAIARALHG